MIYNGALPKTLLCYFNQQWVELTGLIEVPKCLPELEYRVKLIMNIPRYQMLCNIVISLY